MIWLLLFLPSVLARKCYDPNQKLTASDLGITQAELEYGACPSHQFCHVGYKASLSGNQPAWNRRYGSTAIIRFQTDPDDCDLTTNTGSCTSPIQIDDDDFDHHATLSFMSTYTGSGDKSAFEEAARKSCAKNPECTIIQFHSLKNVQFLGVALEYVEFGSSNSCPMWQTDINSRNNCVNYLSTPAQPTEGSLFTKSQGIHEYYPWSICIDKMTCSDMQVPGFYRNFVGEKKLTGMNVYGQLCDARVQTVAGSKVDFECSGICTVDECCGDPAGKTCSSWADCGLLYDCYEGTCQKIVQKCSADEDCWGNHKCKDDGNDAFTKLERTALAPSKKHRSYIDADPYGSDPNAHYKRLSYSYMGEPWIKGMVNNPLFATIPLGYDWKEATGANKNHKFVNYNYNPPDAVWYALKTDANSYADFESAAKDKCDEVDCTFFIVLGHDVADLQAVFALTRHDSEAGSVTHSSSLDGTSTSYRTYMRDDKTCEEYSFMPNTNTELTNAIGLCLAEDPTGACPIFAASTVPSGQGQGTYGPIGTWNTKKIRYLNNLFKDKTQFNQPLYWDATSADTMAYTFQGATAFNSELKFMNMKKVKNFEYMFDGATSFNQDLSYWDTSGATNMRYMFRSSGLTDLDHVNGWDTSNVKNFGDAFGKSCLKPGKLEWDVSSATTLGSMFARQDFKSDCHAPDISSWSLPSTLQSASSLMQYTNVSIPMTLNFPVTISSFFEGAHVSARVIMTNMKSMSRTFQGATLHGDIGLDQWDTSSVTNLYQTFMNVKGNIDGIKNWDVSKVTQWARTFQNAPIRIAPCWDWPVSTYTDTFQNTQIFHKICSANLGSSSHIESDSSCTDLCKDTGDACTADEDCYERTCTNNVCVKYTLMGPCESTDDCNSPERCVNGVCKIGFIPQYASQLKTAINNCRYGQCANQKVPAGQGAGTYGPMNEWDVSLVTDFNDLFGGNNCGSFNQDISQWDTSSVTRMKGTFNQCQQFNQDISQWDTSSVTDMEQMFSSAKKFNQPLDWDTSKVTNMRYMFSNAEVLNQPINFDTSSVTNMENMFRDTLAFNQPLWKFDTSQVTNMEDMFYKSAFNQDIKNWDTSKVTSMGGMFSYSSFLQDISCWDISSVTSIAGMFWSTGTSYYYNNGPKLCWDTSGITNTYRFNAQLETESCTPKNCKNEGEACSAADECFSEYCETNCLPVTLGETCPAAPAQCNGDEVCDEDICKRPTLGESCTEDSDCISVEVCPSGTCIGATCDANEYVEATVCKPCPPGTANEAGDLVTIDSQCDPILCAQDEKVVSNTCTACPPGTSRLAGDDAAKADTSCTPVVCTENHRVKNNECVPCGDGLLRLAGDRADRADTECFDASTCGGVICDPVGTKECVNHRCICNNFFGGQDCSKDRSPSARRKQLLKARKKALPTRANLKQRQKEVKDLAREILQEEIAKGLSVRQAVKNARVEVDIQDIQEEVQIVVAKIAKKPALAVGPENKDETDTCNQGPQCASLDIAEEGDEITFLDTAEEVGSWTALTNGDDIVSKQTRVSETVYDMQCWATGKVFVDAGVETGDFYKFYTDAACTQQITKDADGSYHLRKNTMYTFARCNSAATHPFDVYASGSPGNGITGDETISIMSGDLTWVCTSHSQMTGTFKAELETTWGDATRVDTTQGGKLYECNGHIIVVGSQASVCTPTTCQNGGTCSKDGLSFKCTCQDGFTGEFCETSADITHCHQIDCSDFGGHKAGECTDCNVANCCNYASRALFDAHCDTLTATQDYVNAKCCHRTYCL